jgi:hypothetical protein
MAAGFRVLPDHIKAQIDAVGNADFVFGSVRKYDPAWHSATIQRLELIEVDADTHQGLPPAKTGRWSGWNVKGWTKVWRDRPRISRSFTHEVPNYRGNGYHDITQTRDVFQKSRWFGEQIEALLVHDNEATDVSTGVVQKVFRGPFDESREHEFRYGASQSREWFGDARVFTVGEDGVPEIPTDVLHWEPLPPGTREEIREYVTNRFGGTTPPLDLEIMIDRLAKVESLRPEKQWWGSSGMQRYVGYEFGPDCVAFENPHVGNALYVLRGDWQELSRLSRTELMSSREGEFDRIIHTKNWFDRLRILVYDYRHGL